MRLIHDLDAEGIAPQPVRGGVDADHHVGRRVQRGDAVAQNAALKAQAGELSSRLPETADFEGVTSP